jgi:hypothetical protein
MALENANYLTVLKVGSFFLSVLKVGSKLGRFANGNANGRWVHGVQSKPIVRKPFDFNGFAFYRLCAG